MRNFVGKKPKKTMEEKKTIYIPPRLAQDMNEIERELNKEVPQARLIKQGDSIMNFDIEYTPDSSTYWYGGKYVFSFQFLEEYPNVPPLVHCQTKIYHPNIDFNGNVCLNILKEDWSPIMTALRVVAAVYQLFVVPNPNDPLNHDCAKIMRDDINKFKENVKRTLRGGYVFDQEFPSFK